MILLPSPNFSIIQKAVKAKLLIIDWGDFIKRLILLLLPILMLYSYASASTYTANVSAYTWTGNVMANGEYPYEGAVAADDLPLGTKVRINGQIYVVKDRFGGGYTHRIDIYMDSYERAVSFGRRTMTVEVLK